MNKIAICGKGGVGKSVVTRLLAYGLRRRGLKVLVVDSDESNTGLNRMLGFDQPPRPLIDFMGGRQNVENEVTARMKSGVPEHLVNLMLQNISISQIPSEYILENNGIKLVMVGKILMALEGCACPIGIVSRSFLKSLILESGEVVVIDMEAGVEHFGRGVETSVDCVLVVVEPSLDSLEIAERIGRLASEIRIADVWTVLNKVPSDEIANELTEELKNRGLSVIGKIPYSKQIFESCLRGRPLLVSDVDSAIGSMINFLFP